MKLFERPLLIQFILLLALVLLVYGPTIPLPYFWDDFPQFNFAVSKSYVEHWTDVEGLPYYRPLVTTIFRAVFTILPYGATSIPHLLVLLVHVVNCLLVGRLAAFYWTRYAKRADANPLPIQFVASLLFAIFPFGALPLVHFAAAFHPTVSLLTLAGTVCLLTYVHTGRRRHVIAAFLLALLAPYAHESGVVAGGIMICSLLLYDPSFLLRQKWVAIVLPLVSTLFVLAWTAVPKSQEPNGSLLLFEGITISLAKLSFFGQAIWYPTMPLATWLTDQQGWWDLTAIWLVGGLTLLFLLWLLGTAGQWRMLGLGVGWTAVAMLPSVAALPYDYISISPRLLYFAGPGAVIMWAAVLVNSANHLNPVWLRPFLLFLLTIITAAMPCAYIVRQAQLHTLALTPLRQLTEIATSYPEDRHLIINAPNWIAYQTRWYPIGNDGVAVLAPYLNTKQLIAINSGLELDAEIVTFPELRPNLATHYLATANEAPDQFWHPGKMTERVYEFDHIWFVHYTDEQTTVEYAGYAQPAPANQPDEYLGNFEETVYLLTADFTTTANSLILTLNWFYSGLDPQATIFRNVLTCDGEVAGIGSGTALRATLPFSFLPEPSLIHDVRHLYLDTVDPEGCYLVEVGLFYADGRRVPIQTPDGNRYVNDLIPRSKLS